MGCESMARIRPIGEQAFGLQRRLVRLTGGAASPLPPAIAVDAFGVDAGMV